MRTVDEHIATLQEQAARLADAVELARPDAPIPHCPGWSVRAAAIHTGQVHDWAAMTVRDALTELPPFPEGDLDVPDAELADWYRERANLLVEALTNAPDDLECAAFLTAPSPRAFWARRQAHETSIHRADVEAAVGRAVLFDAEHARDGVDELLLRFVVRPRKKPRAALDPAHTMLVRATEGGIWHVTLAADAITVVEEDKAGDVTVVGPASDLYLLLWNRLRSGDATSGVMVDGDTAVLELWHDHVAIR